MALSEQTTPSAFDVDAGSVDLSRDHFIEAAAGTGKTYSIENIVVRLLIESACDKGLVGVSIDRILVVTFTRAAASELSVRVRAKIEQVCLAIESGDDGPLPSYLVEMFDEDDTCRNRARRALKNALFAFDEAQLFTIHSFCFRMLKENALEGRYAIDHGDFDAAAALETKIRAVKDFLRTGVSLPRYNFVQLARVLKAFDGDVDALVAALLRDISYEGKIQVCRDFSVLFDAFCQEVRRLKGDCSVTKTAIIHDYNLLFGQYKKYGPWSRARLEEWVERFAALFEQDELLYSDFEWLISDGLVLAGAFHPDNRKKRAKETDPSSLHLLHLYPLLSKRFEGIVDEARDEKTIFAGMVQDCREVVKGAMLARGVCHHDDILSRMRMALDNTEFIQSVVKRYSAVVIDEFQDTDPVQWEIFSRLFCQKGPPHIPLFLIGDPKQSIYSFRHADIYTYLQAKKVLRDPSHVTLDVNFRSHPKLITGFNALFGSQNVGRLFSLAYGKKGVDYFPVKSGRTAEDFTLSEHEAGIEFFVGSGSIGRGKKWPTEALEEELFFPYVVQEVKRLHCDKGLSYSRFAILVRDKYQADRVQKFLHLFKVPSVTKRSSYITDTAAYDAFIDLLHAVLNPGNINEVRRALAGKLLRWTDEELITLADDDVLEEVCGRFYDLHAKLYQEGIVSCIESAMRSCWKRCSEKLTSINLLLGEEGGEELWNDLSQLVELLVERETHAHAAPEELFLYLLKLPERVQYEEPSLKRRQRQQEDAVNIMTLHISKGLQFDVVFAVGLTVRKEAKGTLIKVRKGGVEKLVPYRKELDEVKEALDDLDGEKLRQLYVAMTRAKEKLYVPIAVETSGKGVEGGGASPIELYLNRWLSGESQYEPFFDFVETHGDALGLSLCRLDGMNIDLDRGDDEEKQVNLEPPQQVGFSFSPLHVVSFSSLATAERRGGSSLLSPPHDWQAEKKTCFTLPAGKKTGEVLHSLLEGIPLPLLHDKKREEKVLHWVVKQLDVTPHIAWSEVFAQLLVNSLCAKLSSPKGTFSIADAHPSCLIREAEFLYSLDAAAAPNGAMKGFIDLCVQYDGIYYLVDWKSSWLGPDTKSYTADKMGQTMREEDYFLQASIYNEAFVRFLKLTEKRPAEECFGGIFYLFVRGVDPTCNYATGVCHLPWSSVV
ncbi:UvrD-helicase domain-containing protein [Simkania negevensis]|uniref:RecBCD enzyme subunit RecB n=1 Tax=Simkania negevensis TaxID=83561 RepID=A0ABS3AQX4_9BACT|nr:UvrD-helicase domain-containing protein [Simkania negevensis]